MTEALQYYCVQFCILLWAKEAPPTSFPSVDKTLWSRLESSACVDDRLSAYAGWNYRYVQCTQDNRHGFRSDCFLFLATLGLGLVSSLFLWGRSQTWTEPPIQCGEFAAEEKLPVGYFMATKTPYQFLAPVEDESLVQSCEAVQVAKHVLMCIFNIGNMYSSCVVYASNHILVGSWYFLGCPSPA